MVFLTFFRESLTFSADGSGLSRNKRFRLGNGQPLHEPAEFLQRELFEIFFASRPLEPFLRQAFVQQDVSRSVPIQRLDAIRPPSAEQIQRRLIHFLAELGLHNRDLKGGSGMKLKDKKIDIQGVQYVTDKYGNHKKETVTIATVWAYFRQLSGNEIYRVTTQTTEEVMFVINYRTDITTENVILYKGVKYNIVRVDVFEGYKSDLTLYCKRQA